MNFGNLFRISVLHSYIISAINPLVFCNIFFFGCAMPTHDKAQIIASTTVPWKESLVEKKILEAPFEKNS